MEENVWMDQASPVAQYYAEQDIELDHLMQVSEDGQCDEIPGSMNSKQCQISNKYECLMLIVFVLPWSIITLFCIILFIFILFWIVAWMAGLLLLYLAESRRDFTPVISQRSYRILFQSHALLCPNKELQITDTKLWQPNALRKQHWCCFTQLENYTVLPALLYRYLKYSFYCLTFKRKQEPFDHKQMQAILATESLLQSLQESKMQSKVIKLYLKQTRKTCISLLNEQFDDLKIEAKWKRNNNDNVFKESKEVPRTKSDVVEPFVYESNKENETFQPVIDIPLKRVFKSNQPVNESTLSAVKGTRQERIEMRKQLLKAQVKLKFMNNSNF